MSNKSHTHHFVPRFYQNSWGDAQKFVQVFQKQFPDRYMRGKSTKSICCTENLYTARKGNTEVEDKFFLDIDSKAAIILKIIQSSGLGALSSEQKKDFAYFINTLFYRSPFYINMMRDFDERMRQEGAKGAEIWYKETGKDNRHLYIKDDFDDSPKVMQFHHSTTDLDRTINAEWILLTTDKEEVITSDHPLIDYYLGGENLHTKLPEKFLCTLPISPSTVLFICNSPEHILLFKKAIKESLIVQNNIDQIKHADKFIIAKSNAVEEFIRIELKKFIASGKRVYIDGNPK